MLLFRGEHNTTHTNTSLPLERGVRASRADPMLSEHGFHNVSRWMTWLPISLKNAAKCDKWYQLQNHSITESLNANGAREKPSTAIPVHAASLSVEQKPNLTKEPWFVAFFFSSSGMKGAAAEWLPRIHRQTVGSWVIQTSSKKGCVWRVRVARRVRASRLLFSTSEKFFFGKFCAWQKQTSFVTDLSAAGSPAELKHITQRRKRKQP